MWGCHLKSKLKATTDSTNANPFYWKLKGCPRCNGDLFLSNERNWHERSVWCEVCLQCGHREYLDNYSYSKHASARETVLQLHRRGMSSYKIAEVTEISPQRVRQILAGGSKGF